MDFSVPYNDVQKFKINGVTIDVETKTVKQSRNLLGYLEEESLVIERILNNIDSNSVFYDIGALYGPYACIISKYEPNADVHAFEPGKERYEWLEETINRNNVNVTLHNLALGCENSMVKLAPNGEVTNSEGGECIKIVNADDYITNNNDIKPPTIAKIDVEGGELNVIDGMSQVLSEHCEQLYCEVHTNKGVSVNKAINKLQSLGYSVEIISERGSTIHIEATS